MKRSTVRTYADCKDEELVDLLRSRNHAAFTEIYDRYWPLLYIHANKMLHDEDGAMDIIQDIFTIIWKRAAEFSISTSLKSYLYAAVRNQTIKALNRSKVRDTFIQAIAEQMAPGFDTTEETVSYNEFVRILEKEVRALPPKMRDVFEKSRLEGLSHKMISQELDISEHTVKTTIHRALNVLRAKLTSFFCGLALLAFYYL